MKKSELLEKLGKGVKGYNVEVITDTLTTLTVEMINLDWFHIEMVSKYILYIRPKDKCTIDVVFDATKGDENTIEID